MADFTPGNTTIGIEIECLLICPTKGCYEFAEKYNLKDVDDAPELMVHQALDKSFKTTCWIEGCKEEHARHMPLYPLDNEDAASFGASSRYKSADVRSFYSAWSVNRDMSLHLTDEEKDALPESVDYHVQQIEIKSRVLNFNKPTPNPCEGNRHLHDREYDYRFEIQYVLNTLHAHFNNPTRPGYRILVNSSCGAHVHVGGQRVGEWNKIARGVMGMYTAFERQIDTILTTTRISAYNADHIVPVEGVDEGRHYDYPEAEEQQLTHKHAGYCRSASCMHLNRARVMAKFRGTSREAIQDANDSSSARRRMLSRLENDPSFEKAQNSIHAADWLYSIYSSDDIQELEDLWFETPETGHMSAINIENLPKVHDPDAAREYKGTIEFRAHPGSLDPDEWISWVETCARMVETCEETKCSILVKYFLEEWGNPEFTFLDLIRDLGTSSETQEFYNDMINSRYAFRRREEIRQREQSYGPDVLKMLVRVIEDNRYSEKRQRHINEKIRRKFEKGLYGKFPKTFVENMLPADLFREQGYKLIMAHPTDISA